MKIVLAILFSTFSNSNVQFVEKELTSKSYTIAKVPSTTKRIKLINKKKFAKVILNRNSEIFIVHLASFNLALISIHLDKKAYIAFLFTKKIKFLDKYLDFVDIFLEKKVLVLPKRTKLSGPTINLEVGK